MPKGINPDDVVKAALKLLNANKSKVSGVVDDAVGAGKGLAEAAAKALKGSSPKPPKPKMPKNPPKSNRAVMAADDKYLRSEGKKLLKEEKTIGTANMSEDELAILKIYKNGRSKNPPAAGAVAPAPKGPKPKSPKSGSADAAERAAIKEAKSEANSAAWAKQREAYNEMKAIERKERKAQNKANWAKTLEEKYGGNVSAAAKGTSKASKRNKKGAK
jgi:hypothetical protein